MVGDIQEAVGKYEARKAKEEGEQKRGWTEAGNNRKEKPADENAERRWR